MARGNEMYSPRIEQIFGFAAGPSSSAFDIGSALQAQFCGGDVQTVE
jgi:hypothetical protein